jgi:hypothetical protein
VCIHGVCKNENKKKYKKNKKKSDEIKDGEHKSTGNKSYWMPLSSSPKIKKIIIINKKKERNFSIHQHTKSATF